MNRQRYVDRDFQNEGSPRSQELAAALAVKCDPDFLEVVLNLKAALDEFGGQAFIAATRDRVSWAVVEEGGEETLRLVKDQTASFKTLGYITHFTEKATIKRLQTDEEVAAVEEPADADVDVEEPYDGEPEPVGATEET